MVLHGVEEDLQDRDEEAEQQPDVDVLDLGPGQCVGQTGQHCSHNQHGLTLLSIYYFTFIVVLKSSLSG